MGGYVLAGESDGSDVAPDRLPVQRQSGTMAAGAPCPARDCIKRCLPPQAEGRAAPAGACCWHVLLLLEYRQVPCLQSCEG